MFDLVWSHFSSLSLWFLTSHGDSAFSFHLTLAVKCYYGKGKVPEKGGDSVLIPEWTGKHSLIDTEIQISRVLTALFISQLLSIGAAATRTGSLWLEQPN